MSCENNNYTRIPPDLNFPLLTTRGNVDNNAYRWSSEEIQKQLKSTDILLISDDDAFIACYSHMKRVKRGYSIKLGMVDFGRFGDENDEYVKVALMRRSNGASDTQTAVTNAAGILCPKVALLVGICETMKPEKAKRGDVVISARLADVVSNTAIPVSRNMAKLNLYAADGWNPPLKDTTNFEVDVHRQALMLSVPDVSKYCGRQLEDLKILFPDAIVIEIGGIGLYEAAHDLKMEWAIIRGVSTLAGESDSAEVAKLWKRFASAMAASVVHNMFKSPVVLETWHGEAKTQKFQKNRQTDMY